MAQTWARPFYNSLAWVKTRELYIKTRMMIDGGLCEECHHSPGFIVHHKIILTEKNVNDLNVSLNFENLEYVCKSCHDSFEGHGAAGKGKAKAWCTFDEEGNPVSLREIDRA
ncbi:MAG: HNH endonuclease [Lachnospiraceae bacterium]|nr:HNH endonuclease [Lachnospiraceae bacterium]